LNYTRLFMESVIRTGNHQKPQNNAGRL